MYEEKAIIVEQCRKSVKICSRGDTNLHMEVNALLYDLLGLFLFSFRLLCSCDDPSHELDGFNDGLDGFNDRLMVLQIYQDIWSEKQRQTKVA